MSNNKNDNTEVLSYKIDTADFDKGMDKLIAALEKVEKREYLTQLQESIDGIATGVGTMSFNNMEQGLSRIEEKFSTLGVVGTAVIGTLTVAVTEFVKQFVVDKVLGDAVNGFQELNMQINSTQTILSNTASRFGTTLKDVNKGLDVLNDYADKTIYNFSNMTQAVGAFTSAGVDLGNSIRSIKGVANMAAYAGASAESAAGGMYQFSNALSMGYMMLYQWNSLIYSGLGTKTLEQEMIASARGLGIEIDSILEEAGGSFKYSLESGWANQEVILHTLAKFAGEVTEEQLRAMKYTDKEIERILVLGKTATDAATKVISYEKLVTSLSEAVGSGWAKTFRTIVGDFEQGKKLFTMISDNLLVVIERGAENRNKLVEDWSKYGGRDVVVDSIDKLLKTYSKLLLVLGQSLNKIFPPVTGKQLADATKWLGKFVDMLIPTQKGLDNIGRIITGFAATLDIPLLFFKALGRYLYGIIRPMLKFKFTWVDTIVGVADFMTKLRAEIIKGDLFFNKISLWGDNFRLFIMSIKKFLDGVQQLDAVKKMKQVFDAITMRFGIKDPAFLSKFLADAQKSFTKFFSSFDKAGALAAINQFIAAVIGFGKDVYKFLEPAIIYVSELIGNFAKAFSLALKDLSTNFTWDKFKDVLGILTKFLTLKTVISVIERFGFATEIFMTLGMGFAKTIGYIGTAIKQFANSNDADTLLSVAIAIGILSASVFMLATLPQEDIDKGIKAITVIYAGLAGSLMALNKVLAGNDTLMNMAGGSLKLALLPPVLIALAGAVAIMAVTLTKLGAVPTEQLTKGFVALLGILGALQVFLIVDSKLGGMSLTSGLGMVAMATSITILAKAISMFENINQDTITKAAVSVGGLLLIVGALSKAKSIGPQMLTLGASITGIAASLVVLGVSLKYLGSIDFKTTALGLTNVLIMLGAVYFAAFVGSKIQQKAIGKLAVMAIAVAGLGAAFMVLTKVDPAAIILASTAIGLGVGILYGVVSLMKIETMLNGVAGLVALSAGIAVFALALYAFKNVDFGAVALGGLAMATFILGMVALGALAVALPPLVAGLGAFAAVLAIATIAFMLFGAGVMFAGAGVKMFAEGLVLLADGGTKMIDSFIKNIPKFGDAIAQLALVIPKAIVKIYPSLVLIGTALIIALCTGIILATPHITKAILVIFGSMLDIILALGPKLYNTMAVLLMNTMKDLEKNIGTYAVLWNRIQTKFINAMSVTSGPLVRSIYNFFIVVTGEVANTIEKDGGRLRAQMRRLSIAILKFFVDGMIESDKMILGGMTWVGNYVIASGAKVLAEKSKTISKIGTYVTSAIAQGLTNPAALSNLGIAVASIVAVMLGRLREGLDEHSPSRKAFQIASYFMQGLSNGIDSSVLNTKMDTVKDAMLDFMDGSLATDFNFQPTISPILDLGAMSAIEKTIASAFGGQQLAFAGGGYSFRDDPRMQTTAFQPQETTVFQQSISSPAPLTVDEIARRTQSLMAQNRRKRD